jgi:excisionase family DNA binding protein
MRERPSARTRTPGTSNSSTPHALSPTRPSEGATAARHTMNPPVRPSGRRPGRGSCGEGTRRPRCAPTAPSGGRLWHGSAVRRPLLGEGGEALTFGLPDVHREPLGGHPIHITLSPAVQDVATKTEGRTFFTERTLAAYLAVSDRTVRNWIRCGELPSYKLGASRRIDPADVEDFLARHRDEAA